VTSGTSADHHTGCDFDPDGANVIHRFMPSLEVDRAGIWRWATALKFTTKLQSNMQGGLPPTYQHA